MENKELTEWLESEFLLVAEVMSEDIIEIKEKIGIVDSFGKKKFQIIVLHNGKDKIVNLNRFQYNQMAPVEAGARYTISKVSINGGTALNYNRLN